MSEEHGSYRDLYMDYAKRCKMLEEKLSICVAALEELTSPLKGRDALTEDTEWAFRIDGRIWNKARQALAKIGGEE